jgi:hypothetical protein
MAGVLVLAVVFVALGTGYATTKAVVGDDSAWLQKGDTVVQINGPSRRYDAVVANHPVALAASDKDQLQVTEDPTGQVYVANATAHTVYKVNLNTMEPQSIAAPGTGVLATAKAHYVVDASSSVVRDLNPQTLALSAPVKIPGGIASSAISPTGTAYIGSDDGSVTEVTAGHSQTFSVAAKSQQMGVSVVGTEPVAVGSSDGQLHLLSETGATNGPIISLPGVANSTVEVAPALSTGNLWLIRGTQLEQVNLSTTQTSVVSLPNDDDYGAPVTNGGDAYVPDETSDSVLVYDPQMGLVKTVPIPGGLPGMHSIELVVRDGAVWADDPSSTEATVFNTDGSTETVQKGTGDGAVAPGTRAKAPAATPPTTTPVTAPPTTVPPTTVPPTTVPPTTVPPITVPPAPVPAPVVDPTPVAVAVSPPISTPAVTIPPIAPPTTVPPTTTTTSTTTTVPPTTVPPTTVPPTTVPPTTTTTVPPPPPPPTTVAMDTVPNPGSGESYSDYCNDVTNAGLTCDASSDPTSADVACNTVYQESPQAGSSVAPGTQVTADYDPNCSEGLYEWAVCGARYHYLSAGSNAGPPGQSSETQGCAVATVGDWNEEFGAASSDGSNDLGQVFSSSSKPGTQAVYMFTYANGSCSEDFSGNEIPATCPDYDYSINSSAEPNSNGWTQNGVAFYVSGSGGSGQVSVIDADLQSGTPEAHGWYNYAYCSTANSNCDGTPVNAWSIYNT